MVSAEGVYEALVSKNGLSSMDLVAIELEIRREGPLSQGFDTLLVSLPGLHPGKKPVSSGRQVQPRDE